MTEQRRKQKRWRYRQRLKNDLLYDLRRLGFAAARVLPLRGILRLLGCLAPIIFVGAARRARAQLTAVLPEVDAGIITRRMFVHFGESLWELSRLHRSVPKLDDAARRVLDETLAARKGAVLISGHIGNWELLGQTIAAAGYPIASIAKPSYDPRITRWLQKGDGIAVNSTNTMFGPNLRKNIALWVEEKPFVVPEEESQYWWQDYNFSVNMKNQDPGVARVSVSLFTDTEAHPWKIVDTKDAEVGQELRPVYFNVKPFDVLDAGKNFSFKFKYSELDQREKDSVDTRWIKPINEKLLKYDIASFPIVINLFGIMFAAILCGILI